MRHLFQAAVGLSVLFVIANPAAAQPFRGSPRLETRGMLKAIDAKAGTITIATFDGRRDSREPIEKTFTLAKEVEIALDSSGGSRGRVSGVFKEGKVADLKEGAPIVLTLSADEKTVESIVAESLVVRGMIKFVDADKGSITITTRPSRGGEGEEEKSFAIAPGAEIAVDDGIGRRFSVKEAKLVDLAVGASATVRLSADQKTAEAVFAEGPSLAGQLKTVDSAKNTITLKLGGGREDAEERTLEMAKGAMILVDDGRGRRLSVKEAKLADLPTGASVMVRLSVDQKAATLLRAEGPNLPCLIKSVDAAKGTVTIAIRVARGENPEERTFPLAKEARIVVDGDEAKLADIKPNDEGPFAVLRLSLDSKTVQGITVGLGRGR
jgi:hypothetical protein